MGGRTFVFALAISGMVMAGCVSGDEPAASPTGTSQRAATATPSRVTPTAAPAASEAPMLSCHGAGPVFPRTAVTEDGRLSLEELRDREFGAAMFGFFTSGEGSDQLHDLNSYDSFAVLSRSDRQALVGEFRSDQLQSYVYLEVRGDGWDVRNFGDCEPRLAGEQGRVHTARWELTGTSNGGRELQLQAGGGMCNDQPESRTRLLDVQVQETASQVTIAVWVYDPGSPEPCEGVGISIPTTVHLDEPLAERRLLDGGVEPPTGLPQPPG